MSYQLTLNDFESLALILDSEDNFHFHDIGGATLRCIYGEDGRDSLRYSGGMDKYKDMYTYDLGNSYYIVGGGGKKPFKLDKDNPSFIANFIVEVKKIKKSIDINNIDSINKLNKLIYQLIKDSQYIICRYHITDKLNCLVNPGHKVWEYSEAKPILVDWSLDSYYNSDSSGGLDNKQINLFGSGGEVVILYDGELYPYEKFLEMKNFL